jgi:hypothetical protein
MHRPACPGNRLDPHPHTPSFSTLHPCSDKPGARKRKAPATSASQAEALPMHMLLGVAAFQAPKLRKV